MRWTRLFLPTLRETPAGIAGIGDQLLTRAGFIRSEASLMLGVRSIRRIEAILRREAEALGAQELRTGGSPMTDIARELRSYKQLPQVWYQFRAGGFEAGSFSLTGEDLLGGLVGVLDACEVHSVVTEWLGGMKFLYSPGGGEHLIAHAGDYSAEQALAVASPKPPAKSDPEQDLPPEPFHTPGCKTIAELAEFTGLPETSLVKTLVFRTGRDLVMALVRGDDQLSEAKLYRALGQSAQPAKSEEIFKRFGANPGSLGPVGIEGMRILVDEGLRGRRNMITGANRDDYHLRHVTPGEDFEAEYFDLRTAVEGDEHNGEPLRMESALRLASLRPPHLFEGLHVTSEAGAEVPVRCGACTISARDVLRACAGQHFDADGLVLPPAIAPFDVIVTLVDGSNEAQRAAGATIAASAEALGHEVLIDDREERPGVKFKDADLIGVPWRVTIGKKLEQGSVEIVDRRSKQKHEAPVAQVVEFIRTRR